MKVRGGVSPSVKVVNSNQENHNEDTKVYHK